MGPSIGTLVEGVGVIPSLQPIPFGLVGGVDPPGESCRGCIQKLFADPTV